MWSKTRISTTKKEFTSNLEKWITKNIISPNGFVMVAEDKDKLIGYILSNIKKYPPVYKIEKFGYINDLFVKKQYQRKGISSKLKDESFGWFKKKGLKHAAISVSVKNLHAHSVYKKWGFEDDNIDMKRKI